MNCATVMNNNPVFGLQTDNVANAAAAMREADLDSIPVCESPRNSRFVGLITEHAISRAVVAEHRNAENTLVSDVMIREPIRCLPDDDPQKALALMQLHSLNSIPIVDRDGILVGNVDQRYLRGVYAASATVYAASATMIPSGFLGC